MSELYYIEPCNRARLSEGYALLTGAESQHLTRVMRKRVGDEANLFDGSGREYRCVIESVSRDETTLRVCETIEDDREPEVALTAIMALPKGERQKWAIEKLTELGVRRLIPLDASRADVKSDGSTRERLERRVLEATKQCGRLRLMSVLPSISPEELPGLVESLDARLSSGEASAASDLRRRVDARYAPYDLFDELALGDEVLRVIAHPKSDGDFGQLSFVEFMRERAWRAPRAVWILIGPVGGFTDAEVATAVAQGWSPLDFGRQVYRVETAAIVASSLFLHLT